MMSESVLVQGRVPKESKDRANEVLKNIGLSMSAYLNMAVEQLAIQGRIPFEAKTASSPYTFESAMDDVAASFAMEGMNVSDHDKELLHQLWHGEMDIDTYKKAVLREEGITE
ncbi:MAG: type II toxin-antitoxin system RelB/DinJ family antitoxin [Pseudoramibacter sp.]